jgi:hypothetical protein
MVKRMNEENQEDGALRGPQIFTVPACGFIVALNLDWGGGQCGDLSVKASSQEVQVN